MSENKFDYSFKFVIIGECGVGKTSILLRFVDDSFTKNKITTIDNDFKNKTINLEGKLINLEIWDTAGAERFRILTKSFYKDALGIILTYDITDKFSFKCIRLWMKEIEAKAPDNVCIILVGKKCDRPDRRITEEQGKDIANLFNMPFFEASAKENKNINEIFSFLAKEILKSTEGKTQVECCNNPCVIN